MFKFLKEKIGNWAKKISQEKEEAREEIVEAPKEEIWGKKLKKAEKKKPGKEAPKKEEKITEPEPKNIVEGKIEDGAEKPIEKKGFFRRITEKISRVEIDEKEFAEYSEELEMMLLENNVALEVAEKIIKELEEKIVGKQIPKKEIESEIKTSLKESIENILVEPFDLVEKIKEKNKQKEPYVILFCGINGSGKTTTIAKIANLLKNKNISCVMAAGDTFRAASIEQLKKHGENLGIKVISQEYGADPAAVGFDAIQYAKKNLIKCVLIDTAGRMHTAKNLLNEMGKISRITKPDVKIFVGESITGNDALEQIKGFDESIGIDGIILSKADIDEKGGTALSVGYVTKKPILYLGVGQGYDDIEPFDKKKFIEKLGL